MNKVIWLCSWYPSKLSQFNGDFIQRHAQAVAQFLSVEVIHVVKDERGIITNDVLIEKHVSKNLHETIVYYKPLVTGIKPVDKIASHLKYVKLFKQTVAKQIAAKEKPLFIHVNVVMKAGVIGSWMKSKYRVPYILTEHWTAYQKESPFFLASQNWFYRRDVRRILNNASLILPVSRDLGVKMQRFLSGQNFEAISNVVDTTVFKYSGEHIEVFRIVHVSSMTYQKNIHKLLDILSKLKEKSLRWECVLVGDCTNELQEYCSTAGLDEYVTWKGPLSYEDVATEMKNSSVLVMCSWYENLPCVILEALCCGLPVISNAIGGIPEIINTDNGKLVEPDTIEKFVEAIVDIQKNYGRINRQAISDKARSQFNYNKVGLEIISKYRKLGYQG